MVQKSVYSKICLNGTQVESHKRRLRKNKPTDGIVQILVVTEKQYSRIEYLVGTHVSDSLANDERLVIL